MADGGEAITGIGALAGSAEHERAVRRYLTPGFSSVHRGHVVLQLTDQMVLLSHFSFELAYCETVGRYADHLPADDGRSSFTGTSTTTG